MGLKVAKLFRYPLKSAAGERCESVRLDRFGVAGDRRWMVVDPGGSPLTQRELPELALLRARSTATGLDLGWGGLDQETISVPFPQAGAVRTTVVIWGDRLQLPLGMNGSAAWLSDHLRTGAFLAYMPDDVQRPVNPKYADETDRTALTDGYPLHLVGSGSLADLNDRLASDIGIERFRPNIYVEEPPAFDEDDWTEIEIGGLRFRVVKPCPRCTVTTVDPGSGIRGKEPLATLARYRRKPAGVMFGQNVIHDSPGSIRVGDPVTVISRRDTPEA